ncbi:hypothetical protein [Amycolatopsis sp. NPDC051128]|uniref:hypothetical protein n=1 Tax=Amycolatopsis sp. NPDC051128 TaxID=3155412 RepID=UPI0034167E51
MRVPGSARTIGGKITGAGESMGIGVGTWLVTIGTVLGLLAVDLVHALVMRALFTALGATLLRDPRVRRSSPGSPPELIGPAR